MTIRVLSFDFDGCLFNENYVYAKIKDVIQANEAFLNTIKQENKAFKETYCLIGSNRQSAYTDLENSFAANKGSCFPAIKKISDLLGTILDTFLLADIYGNLKSGTSYARAIEKTPGVNHEDWLFDETKATILYAQIHKMANEHSQEKIVFDFYDDRGMGARGKKVDILEQLRDFFGKNPNLIPSNVTLRLHQYAGNAVTPIVDINGTGFIDGNYKQTVKDLAQLAVRGSNDGKIKPLYVTEFTDPSQLSNRKALVIPLVTPANTRFAIALRRLNDKATELRNKAYQHYNPRALDTQQSSTYHSYINAAQAATNLYDALNTASKNYFADHNQAIFKAIAERATQAALDSELKNHRGHLKQLLGYAGLAVLAVLSIATVGVAFAAAGGINYVLNKQFFFSTRLNTDSVNKVNDLKAAVNEIVSAPA